jgi:hypothetical protein
VTLTTTLEQSDSAASRIKTLPPSAVIARSSPWRWVLATGLSLAGTQLALAPARAGLLAPILQMMRPRIESRLAEECRKLVSQQAGESLEPELNRLVEQPCRSLARPVSACLIRETSRTGRELGVISELVAGRVGDDAEVVIKRCIASMLGLSESSLQELPLQTLVERWRR